MEAVGAIQGHKEEIHPLGLEMAEGGQNSSEAGPTYFPRLPAAVAITISVSVEELDRVYER